MRLDWLVFCDCGFQSVCPVIEKDETYGSLLVGKTEGELGLILMGGAMLSKSLSQFSVDGWSWFPPCYLPGAKLWWG